VGPVPPPADGGIAAYLDGLLRSDLARRYELTTFDVRPRRFFRRHRGLRPLLTVKFVLGYTLRLASSRPDLVHIHASDNASLWEKSLLAGLARMLRRPYLLHLHGNAYEPFLMALPPAGRRLAALGLRGARRVIVLSERARGGRLAELAGLERLVVLPNAIHMRDFEPPGAPPPGGASAEAPLPGSGLRLIFVGNLCSDKGVDDLLQALSEVVRSGSTNFQVDLVGDELESGERARYLRLAEQTGLAPRLHFLGTVVGDRKLELLRAADLFVLPTHRESFGIANLEAMACGLPVVSTRTGAIPDYLTDGVDGLLVEPGDVPALAAALRRLLGDGALRRRLGEAARRRVQELDWSVAAASLAQVYEQALCGWATPAGGRPEPPAALRAANP